MRSSDVHAVARAIYGTILVTALVAALSEYDDSDSWQILVSVVVTTLVFWSAHVYAEVLSQRLAVGRGLTWREVGRAFGDELPMVIAAVPAVLALLGAVVGLYSRDTGAWLAVAIGVAALFAYGLLLGYREHAPLHRVLLNALVNGAFGFVVVALKAFVH